MADLLLLIGSKNHSSWSVRAWLALRQTGAVFDEEVIPLGTLPGQFALAQRSPTRKVPVLMHGDLAIWDSLAITEYLAEIFPEAGLWPRDRAARALARSACAEMHSGFDALRTYMPMDVRASKLERTGDVGADIKRIQTLWRQFRERHEHEGPYLFGAWSAADAAFAPVVSRFLTYDVELDSVCRSYADAVLRWPAVIEWFEAARAEPGADSSNE